MSLSSFNTIVIAKSLLNKGIKFIQSLSTLHFLLQRCQVTTLLNSYADHLAYKIKLRSELVMQFFVYKIRHFYMLMY